MSLMQLKDEEVSEESATMVVTVHAATQAQKDLLRLRLEEFRDIVL